MFGLSLLNVRSRNNINVNFLLYPCVTFYVVQQLSACFGELDRKKNSSLHEQQMREKES